MTNKGLDYGNGQTNIDWATGIRFGVISQNSIGQAWSDCSEPDYGDAVCPKCGGQVHPYPSEDYEGGWAFTLKEIEEEFEHSKGCDDYVCYQCKYVCDSQDVFGEEPVAWEYKKKGYVLRDCLDSDVIITKSPYYTFAQFCSPCVPGACNLDHPIPDGAKCYCIGHDWFEDEIAPYPVYRVEDNVKLVANKEDVTCRYCNGTGYRSTLDLAQIRNETLEETEVFVMSHSIGNPTLFEEYDPINHTYACNVCHKTGKRQEVVTHEEV